MRSSEMASSEAQVAGAAAPHLALGPDLGVAAWPPPARHGCTGALSGSTSVGLECKVSVPRPASLPRSNAHLCYGHVHGCGCHLDVIREKHSIRLEHSDKYLEIKHDFFPKRMTPGLEIYSENIFEHNSANPDPEGTELLEGLAQAMKYSRGAKLLFNISAKDADKPANAKNFTR